MNRFEKYSNYDFRSNFSSVVFGHDAPLLESELNELQQIQESKSKNIINGNVYSGFTELVQSEFTGEPIVYNPTDNGLTLTNCIAIAPFRAIVNGIFIEGQGNFSYNRLNNYILIDLGEAEQHNVYDTLVYLEVWQEYIHGDESVKKYGFDRGDSIGEPALDKRVASETSRRIGTFWDIKVAKDIDFDTYPEGMGYKDITAFAHVYATANGQFGKPDVNASFCEASNDLFLGETFYRDYNLYVGGRSDYNVKSSNFVGHYCFALPMFRVRRRNTSGYSIANYNGSASYNEMVIANDSSKYGDLDNGMRPDGLAYDIIDKSDVIDLRKTISFNGFDGNALADETIMRLYRNELTTKATKKMRRVQFGNQHIDFEKIPKAVICVSYDKTVVPEKPVAEIFAKDGLAPLIMEDDTIKYEDSVCGFGAVIGENKELRYVITDDYLQGPYFVSATKGTIDFYFKPFWNGSDVNENQTIISILNDNNAPIFKLRKDKTKLILSHYNMEDKSSAKYNEEQAIMDLSEVLLKANQYYHFRIAWTEEPMPTNGQMYLYLNGNLIVQSDIAHTNLIAKKLVVGDSEYSGAGFLIDTLICYSDNFERLILNDTDFGYAKNQFFPMMPADFVNADTLFMPNFNSVVNNYSDNAYTQKETVLQLDYDKTQTLKTFSLHLCSDKLVASIEKVYDMSGKEVAGVWTGIGTSDIQYKPYDQKVEHILVEMTIELSSGCGGQDMPTDIVAAGLVGYPAEVKDYNYELLIQDEVSYNDISAENRIRQVHLLKPRKVSGMQDAAYDCTNEFRNHHDCYARLLYYNISGNGTNQYDIPIHIYGYKVCGIIGCSCNNIKNVIINPSEIAGEADISYTVELENVLLVGETITLYVVTEGYSFDSDLMSKTLVSNVYRCLMLEFNADGIKDTYTLPCLGELNEGVIHGGLLKAVSLFTENELDPEGKIIGKKSYNYCFQDGKVYYDAEGNPTNKRKFNMQKIEVHASSYDTPFITISFAPDEKPRKDTIIRIPIMVTYQMPKEKMLSVWYKYIPYQGYMKAKKQTLKRVSDWKYFATTLGTGKTNDENIKINIINNLPGGLCYGYCIDNKDIILRNMFEGMPEGIRVGKLNKRIVFANDFILTNKDAIDTEPQFCNLATVYKVMKNCSAYQDGMIEFEGLDFDIYMCDCKNAINKYVGGYCTVRTETGELMLFVVGNLDRMPTTVNRLAPVYGDLFRIVGAPSTKY